MRVLSLFSGGGLGDYGLTLAGMEIVGQVEIDDYCQKILKLRWPDVPKWSDIKNVKGSEVLEKCGRIDLISGGFPCQDISVAGTREGIGGGRSSLWKEQFRIICEIRPNYCLVENSPNLLSRGLGVVLGDLAAVGYDAEWECLPASTFGAPHRRDRIWIIAYPGRNRLQRVAFTGGIKKIRKKRAQQLEGLLESERRLALPAGKSGGVHDGASYRMERLKLLGNGQFVDCVYWIGKRILEAEKIFCSSM